MNSACENSLLDLSFISIHLSLQLNIIQFISHTFGGSAHVDNYGKHREWNE